MVGLILRLARRLAGSDEQPTQTNGKLREKFIHEAEHDINRPIEKDHWPRDSHPHSRGKQRRRGEIKSDRR